MPLTALCAHVRATSASKLNLAIGLEEAMAQPGMQNTAIGAQEAVVPQSAGRQGLTMGVEEAVVHRDAGSDHRL